MPVAVNRLVAVAIVVSATLGGRAFEFSLPSGGEVPVRSADYPGRPIALVLWASWSPPSRLLARTLAELRGRPAYDRIAFIGVNFEAGTRDERLEATRRFAAEFRVSFPLALGDEDFRRRVKGFRGFPSVLLLGADHRVAHLFSGFDERPETRGELEKRLLALLPEPPGR